MPWFGRDVESSTENQVPNKQVIPSTFFGDKWRSGTSVLLRGSHLHVSSNRSHTQPSEYNYYCFLVEFYLLSARRFEIVLYRDVCEW